jgi:hypothetical protein
MNAGTINEHNDKNGLHETDQKQKSQRIILVLFLLAFLSLGVYIVLQLLMGQTL